VKATVTNDNNNNNNVRFIRIADNYTVKLYKLSHRTGVVELRNGP